MPVYRIPMFVNSPDSGSAPPVKRGCSLSGGNTHYEDIATLGVGWWYNWSATPGTNFPHPGFMPMSWSGQMIDAGDAPIILWVNEPENAGQANLTPSVAAGRYAKMYAVYGDRLWPAGVAQPWVDWTGQFVAELYKIGIPTPTHWHIHGYAEAVFNLTVDKVIAWWTQMHDRFPGDYIVSEFGTDDGDPGKMRAFVDWMENTPWIVRYAAFSNRVDDSAKWYPSHWPKPYPGNLVASDGTPTPLGRAYIENKF